MRWRAKTLSPQGVFACAERVKQKFSLIVYVSGIIGDCEGRLEEPKGSDMKKEMKKKIKLS